MSAYNLKINTDGTYRKFHGYTVLSKVSDDLSKIEDFIKQSKFISKYFAPLPANSYHVTVFNIWCHGQKLLPFQHQWLDEMEKREKIILKEMNDYETNYPLRNPPPMPKSFKEFKIEFLRSLESDESVSFINMEEFYPIMNKADAICKKYAVDEIVSVIPRGVSSSVHFKDATGKKYGVMRKKLAEIVGHGDSNLVPHMTFAYKYRDILEEDRDSLMNEIKKLNSLTFSLVKDGVKLTAPRAFWFRDMLSYHNSDEIYF